MGKAVSNQSAYRGRGDTVGLNSTSFDFALNTDFQFNADETFRIRFEVEETGGGNFVLSPQLEFQTVTTAWVSVSTTSSVARAVNSAQYTDGDSANVNLLTGSTETFSTTGTGSEDGLAADVSISNQHVEIEFALQLLSTDVSDSQTINFRITDAGTALDGYDDGGGAGSSIPVVTASVLILKTVSDSGSASETFRNSALYPALDETSADDNDYVESGLSPSNDTFEIQLGTIINRHVQSGWVANYRYGKNASSGAQIDLTVNVYDGATLISSTSGNTHTNISDTLTDGTITLTASEIASISDTPDLRLRFVANEPSGTPGRRAWVTWAELQVPEQPVLIIEAATGTDTVTVTPSGAITKTVTDSASGADVVSISASVPQPEASSVTDAPVILASLSVAESGSAIDTVSRIVGISVAVSATGTEALSASNALSDTDLATGSDTIDLAANVPQGEQGSGSEFTLPGASVPVSDIGQGTDSPAVMILRTVADSATGLDIPLISATVSQPESGTGADTFTILASLIASDSASGVDAVIRLILATIAESATGAETVDLSANVPMGEGGSGSDSQLPGALVPIDESGIGVDAATATDVGGTVIKTVSEVATTLDVVAQVSVTLQPSDTASGVSTLSIIASFASSDTAQGDDLSAIMALAAALDALSGIDSSSIQASAPIDDNGATVSPLNVAVSLEISDNSVGTEQIALYLTKTISDLASSLDNVSLTATIQTPDSVAAVDILSQVLAAITIIESGDGAESITLDTGEEPVASITLTLSNRSMTLTISQQSITLQMSEPTMVLTADGGQ